MGWGRRTALSHAERLRGEGWVESTPMTRGAGSLVWVTRTGVAVSGVEASPLAGPPAPTTWAHAVGCAWVAAWLSARGREVRGTRELLLDDGWRGELEWLERDGLRRRGHRPDLLGGYGERGAVLPIEVELAQKSAGRLRAILALHASWVAAGKTSAVIYVCGGPRGRARVQRTAGEVGLSVESKRLRVELLEDIKRAALDARTSTPVIA